MQQALKTTLNRHLFPGRLSEQDVVTILDLLPEESNLLLSDWRLVKNTVARRLHDRNVPIDDLWRDRFWTIMEFGMRSLISLSDERGPFVDCQRTDWITALADELSAGEVGELVTRDRPKLQKKARLMLNLLLQEAERLRAAKVAQRITVILRRYETGECTVEIHRAGSRQISAHAYKQAG
jgi:hypothetical protein